MKTVNSNQEQLERAAAKGESKKVNLHIEPKLISENNMSRPVNKPAYLYLWEGYHP